MKTIYHSLLTIILSGALGPMTTIEKGNILITQIDDFEEVGFEVI